MVALLCVSDGNSVITETVWENRFQYINELKRLGCNVAVVPHCTPAEEILALAPNGLKTLYVSGEESAQQIKMRAARLGEQVGPMQ